MRINPLALTVVLLCCLLQVTNALYFNLVEGKPQCFLTEVPSSTLVVGKYNNLDHAKLGVSLQQNIGMLIQVVVTGQGKEQLLQQNLGPSGKFTFTSLVSGEYTICIQTAFNEQQNRLYRMELSVEIGEQAIDYTNIAKSEHLSAIEVEIRRLNDRITQIRAESDFQRTREEAFRNTSESNNSRVVWYNILIALAVAGAAVFQYFYLKRFFKRKKVA